MRINKIDEGTLYFLLPALVGVTNKDCQSFIAHKIIDRLNQLNKNKILQQ